MGYVALVHYGPDKTERVIIAGYEHLPDFLEDYGIAVDPKTFLKAGTYTFSGKSDLGDDAFWDTAIIIWAYE